MHENKGYTVLTAAYIRKALKAINFELRVVKKRGNIIYVDFK